MRQKVFWITASCVLVILCMRPVFSSGAAPASTEKVIYSFQGGTDGAAPMSDLTLDSAGNLYGTTSQGGSAGYGTVFELKHTAEGWKEEVLYSFTVESGGYRPVGGVIFDKAGSLYGITAFGGKADSGTAFRLTPNSGRRWTESVIYSFDYGFQFSCCGAGQGDLVSDAAGNLYGTVPQGVSGGDSCGQQGCGAVFRLSPKGDGSWTETTIHTFSGAPDGATPVSAVILDKGGKVRGLTVSGGTGRCRTPGLVGDISGCGTFYEITPHSDGGWSEALLYSFVRGGGAGIYPSGELFLDTVNHTFGLAGAGGDRFGTMFKLQETKEKSWEQRGVHIFYGGVDGTSPVGRLVANANGDLFGVTYAGGSSENGGTVFEVKVSNDGWHEKILHSFARAPDGASPVAGPVLSPSSEHLYGTTQYGGTGTSCQYGCGTVYEVAP